jgi:G3E family GTPase
VHKASPGNVEKAHHAVSGAGNPNFRPSSGMARIDKPGGQHDPTGGDHHVIHAPDHVTHSELKKNLSGYGARATIVDTHTGNRETVHEGFDQIDEEAKATVDALKKVHGDHNFHVDKKGEIKHAYLNNSHVEKLVTALKTPGKGKGMIDRMMEEVADKVVADKVRTKGSVKFFSKKKLPGSDKSSMNEVAMPQNQADWQAMINHQIKIADHPVATDAQFRATNGKDKTKIASLEPGEDMLQYATAQGGTVKR